MVTIEDLYLRDEANLEKHQTENDILEYNNDIDIIKEVIRKILVEVWTYRPAAHSTITPQGSDDNLVCWNICRGTREDRLRNWIYLLSNGKILFSYTYKNVRKDKYINLEHITDLANKNPIIQEYRLRKNIVNMAVTLFKIDPKSNWGYIEYRKTETYPETTIRLLSEILEVLKQERKKTE
jgi:hypothetical protein